jgi:hypothetical protein
MGRATPMLYDQAFMRQIRTVVDLYTATAVVPAASQARVERIQYLGIDAADL